MIVFETKNEWTFDMFGDPIETFSFASRQASSETLPAIEVKIQESVEMQEKDVESIMSTLSISEAGSESDEDGSVTLNLEPSKLKRPACENTLASLAKFIEFVRDYYSSLPAAVAKIYLESGVCDNDLGYAPESHKLLHTKAGNSAKLERERLYKAVDGSGIFQIHERK